MTDSFSHPTLARTSRLARHSSLCLVGLLGAMAILSCSPASEENGTGAAATEVSTLEHRAHTEADLDLVREIEDHRLLNDPRLKNFLHSTDASVAAAAATAAGRIGDPSLTADLVSLLDAHDARVRRAAAFALGLLGGDGVENALDARLAKETDDDVRAQLLLALGRRGTVTSLAAVAAPLAKRASSEVQAAAAEALGLLVRNGAAFTLKDATEANLLTYAGKQPEARATASAYALAGLSAQNVAVPESNLVAAYANSPSPTARAYLTRSLALLATPGAIAALVKGTAHDPNAHVRSDSCRFLARTPVTPTVLNALSAALGDPSPEVVVAAATAIGTLGAAAASLAPALSSTYDASHSDWVRSTVLSTLAAVDKEAARTRVQAGLSGTWPVQLSAIGALPLLGTAADLAELLPFASGSDTRLAFAALEALATIPPAQATAAMKSSVRAALAKKDFELTVGAADAVVALNWTDFADDFRALYDAFPGQANMDGRRAVLFALGTVGSTADVPLFARGLSDDERLVEQTAAASYKAITGTDVTDRVRLDSVVRTATPSHEQVEQALQSRVVLETTRGIVVLRMFRETSLSATNFVQLASKGFYDGLPFHRVVPNFVSQGGDPRGDGNGGSPNLVREELSPIPHRRGTVGMATEGKDTGSSQFFINNGWNVSLDAQYTVFAEVVWGMDVADRIEVGDIIQHAIVIGGSDTR